jgi:putative transposase
VESNAAHRKRCVRYNLPGHAHELTFSCYQRRPFLRSSRACSYLAEAIARARLAHDFRLLAYVFMPEHVHLLIWPAVPDYSISVLLRSIKQSVSRRIVEHLRRDDPDGLRVLATGQTGKPYRFWQAGGGYDRNITELTTLQTAADYIHANPVRRGLARSAVEWHWSSAREWLGDGHGPIEVDMGVFEW